MLRRLFHTKCIKLDCCPIRYPWGWRCQTVIESIKNQPKKDLTDILVPPTNNVLENAHFYDVHFMIGVKYGYETIYNAYKNKINFLEKEYTSPSLAIALNELQSDRVIPELNLDNVNVTILDNWIDDTSVNANNKILGFFCSNEIIHYLVAGAIGPEHRDIWDQKGYKQIVRVVYDSGNRIDIWDWERDIMIPDQYWHVSNINEII